MYPNFIYNDLPVFHNPELKIVTYIESFVKFQDAVNEEAYFDLFSAKAKVSSVQQVSVEIDSLVKK